MKFLTYLMLSCSMHCATINALTIIGINLPKYPMQLIVEIRPQVPFSFYNDIISKHIDKSEPICSSQIIGCINSKIVVGYYTDEGYLSFEKSINHLEDNMILHIDYENKTIYCYKKVED